MFIALRQRIALLFEFAALDEPLNSMAGMRKCISWFIKASESFNINDSDVSALRDALLDEHAFCELYEAVRFTLSEDCVLMPNKSLPLASRLVAFVLELNKQVIR